MNLLTYQEAAARLGVSPTKLRRLVNAGAIPALKLDGKRLVRFRESDLAEWINSQPRVTPYERAH